MSTKTVIYKINSYTVVRVVDDAPCITTLPADEDFIPLSMWNECAEDLGYPKI